MRGLLPALLLVAIGCQSRPQAMDPFMRTRIPPPGTGDVGPIPTGAYGAPVGAAAPPPPGATYAPPGGSFNYNGGQLTPVTPPPGSAPPVSSTYPGAVPPPSAAPPAGPYGAPAVPTYQQPAAYPSSAPVAPPSGSPPYAPPGGGWAPTSSVNGPPTTSMYSRETMQRELRPLGETARAGVLGHAATDMPADDGSVPGELSLDPSDKLSKTPMAAPLRDGQDTRAIEPVSYTVPQGAPPRVIQGAYAAVDSPNARQSASSAVVAGNGPADRGATYGYDANYAWLQGQLEYSDATKQWKLRYVPVSGPTDKYGGSVVLAPSPALAGLRAGDFVSVKGKVASTSPTQGSFAPLYQVSAADRLTD